MPNDGQIVFEVELDGKHAKADLKDITRAIQQETGKWDTAAKESSDKIGGSFGGVLKKLSIAAIGAGVVNGLKNLSAQAIQSASDLQEVQNVVDVTFGENAGQIETWSKKAGSQFGLTETQAKKFSSTMGAMLKSSGMAGKEIVQVSTDLAGLAADMASFYNLDFDEAFSKIRSGISGQTMPLKELGIDLSVATLNAFALSQGLEKSYDKMTQSEQVMLRYQYLMQATSDAQGDFARTADGYANATRKMETNIESLKTKLGSVLLPVISEVVAGINGMIESLLPDESKRTVLDDFADIDLKTQQKLEEIESMRREADELKNLLNEVYSGGDTTQGTEAADVVAKYGVKSNETAEYLKNLGFTTDEITQKGENWLETCKRLVKVIPGLNSIINTETGEVKGGVSAIDDYVKAWEQGQKKIALLRAQEERKSALQAKYAEIPGLEVDMLLAENRLKKAHDQLQKYADQFKVDLNWYGGDLTLFDEGAIRKWGLTNEQYSLLEKEVNYYLALKKNADDATAAFEKQNGALQEGLKIIEDGAKAIEETYGATDEATEKAAEWSEELQDAGKAAVSSSNEALKALEDYVQGVRDAVAKSIESTVSGFEVITRPVSELEKKRNKLVEDQMKVNQKTKEGRQEYEKLEEQIKSLNEQIDKYSPGSMQKALQSQKAFMEEYIKNLEAAQKMGLSNELLASLSDGSVESAEYLTQLVADPEAAKQIDALYNQVQEKKKELTDALSQQQLTVDQVYQQMLDDAKAAVAGLDLEGSAQENSGKTIAGIAQGIADHVPDVKEQVDAVLAQLERLKAWGVDVETLNIGTIPQHETGLNYVPFDGYLASLHEGEGILTAEENRIWQRFKAGQGVGIDYDVMGGVMRDNIKPGGNVYLDGRQVGQVVSDVQGRQYRQLQRSGWQR